MTKALPAAPSAADPGFAEMIVVPAPSPTPVAVEKSTMPWVVGVPAEAADESSTELMTGAVVFDTGAYVARAGNAVPDASTMVVLIVSVSFAAIGPRPVHVSVVPSCDVALAGVVSGVLAAPWVYTTPAGFAPAAAGLVTGFENCTETAVPPIKKLTATIAGAAFAGTVNVLTGTAAPLLAAVGGFAPLVEITSPG